MLCRRGSLQDAPASSFVPRGSGARDSAYLDRAQSGGVLTRTCEHVIGVGAGNDEPRAEPNQFALQRGVVANPTHAQHFVVRPTRSRHLLIGGAQPRMIDLSRNAKIGRQVTRAD